MWKEYTSSDLPELGCEWAAKHNIFRSGMTNNEFVAAFHEGNDPETAKRWIIITDDGGYYKVFATYMLWYDTPEGESCAQALWSEKALNKSLNSIMKTGKHVEDPDYQS